VRKSRWFSVHRWLGIMLGAWFALVGLSGSILVFEEPIDAWLNPALLTSRERGPALLPEELLLRVAEEHEALGGVERIRPPDAPGDVYRLVFRVQPNKRIRVDRMEAMFAPVTGRLLGTRPVEALGLSRPQLLKTIYEFHRNVLLGTAGSNIVGIAGFLLLASAVTGVVSSMPRNATAWKRLIHVNLRAHRTRVFYDVHRSAGVLFCVLLMLATLTGSTLVYLNYVRDVVNVFSPVKSFPTVPWTPGTPEESASFGRVIDAVRVRYAEHRIAEIHVPFRQTAGYLFYLRRPGDEFRLGNTIAWVHPVTAQILVERSDRTRTRGETLIHWFLPLHTGTAFGTPGLVAMSTTGLAPLMLVATGLAVWLRKRRGEKIGERRRRARDAVSLQH
jgi:uncharacterized iron-regulated membrane protein